MKINQGGVRWAGRGESGVRKCDRDRHRLLLGSTEQRSGLCLGATREPVQTGTLQSEGPLTVPRMFSIVCWVIQTQQNGRKSVRDRGRGQQPDG